MAKMHNLTHQTVLRHFSLTVATNLKKPLMNLKFRILLNGLILISVLSCKSQSQELTSDFLIGKWAQYDGTITENGITKKDSLTLLASPILYDFKVDGIIELGYGIEEKMDWKISTGNKLLIGIDNQFADYKSDIKSDSTIILSREYKDKIFSYHFKRGWKK